MIEHTFKSTSRYPECIGDGSQDKQELNTGTETQNKHETEAHGAGQASLPRQSPLGENENTGTSTGETTCTRVLYFLYWDGSTGQKHREPETHAKNTGLKLRERRTKVQPAQRTQRTPAPAVHDRYLATRPELRSQPRSAHRPPLSAPRPLSAPPQCTPWPCSSRTSTLSVGCPQTWSLWTMRPP